MVENFVSYLRNKGAVLSKISKLREHSKWSECQLKLVATESGIEHDHCLQQLSSLRDLIFQTFRIIDFISPTVKTIPKIVYEGITKSWNIVPILLEIFTKNGVKNLPPGH